MKGEPLLRDSANSRAGFGHVTPPGAEHLGKGIFGHSWYEDTFATGADMAFVHVR